ncbi:hypothetical protein [[Flexibacter] sp. ATCC 35103]|uniref:hypothetical protein n=1 Tax=[Flexibacter] sp. ATCC 35103 TaxID=1937528 RepID=UPI0009CB129F|nr:hypothetical protein [[Flexibacter] sp. ATCC 35103]OMQ13548.1 hypothetical protein BXU01_03460 [[Flexibacter] sp. ATCC 35103]
MINIYLKIITVLFLILLIGCKNDKTAKQLILEKKTIDSIAVEKKRTEEYKVTKANNKEIVSSIIFENRTYDKENDFTSIKSVLLETPINISFADVRVLDYRKEVVIYSFGLQNYLEYKKPYKEYCPFINGYTNEMEFIVSYETPVKISFKNGQYFWLGKDYKWLTPKIKVTNSLDYQDYDKDWFKEINNQQVRIGGGDIIKYRNKIYLILYTSYERWVMHHLFDITDTENIKYYILTTMINMRDVYDSYGDFNNDGKLDFKQKYTYLEDIYDKSKGLYKIYTLPE